jgi:hypothetical protein
MIAAQHRIEVTAELANASVKPGRGHRCKHVPPGHFSVSTMS